MQCAEDLAHDSRRFCEVNVYMTPEWIAEKVDRAIAAACLSVGALAGEHERLRNSHTKLVAAMEAAFVENQNMHCFATKGRLNEALNRQTGILRAALAHVVTP